MEPITDPDCPFLDNGIPIPRMIAAQFDAIRLERFYKPHFPAALKSYQDRIGSGEPQSFFTIYLSTFLLLDLVPIACYNRLRQRRQQAMVNVHRPPVLAVEQVLTWNRRHGMVRSIRR